MPVTRQNIPALEKNSILVVSPNTDDLICLSHILHAENWQVVPCGNVTEAAFRLESGSCSMVICERDLPDGNWKDILNSSDRAVKPPLVLVASHQADESLWGEVINLGGYDVLLKPFDASEVTRVVDMAWRYWFRPSPSRLATQIV